MQGGVDVLVLVEGGEDDDAGGRRTGGDPAGGLDAVEHGHPDVHHHDVGAQFLGEADGLGAVPGLADHLQVLGLGDDHLQGGPDEGLVVGEEDADGRDGGDGGDGGRGRGRAGHRADPVSGRRAVTRKPPSGRGAAVKSPCSRATRSRRPTSP